MFVRVYAFVCGNYVCYNLNSYLSFVCFINSVDDVYATSDRLEKVGCEFQKKPDEGKDKYHCWRMIMCMFPKLAFHFGYFTLYGGCCCCCCTYS
jgi:hypothetical protein